MRVLDGCDFALGSNIKNYVGMFLHIFREGMPTLKFISKRQTHKPCPCWLADVRALRWETISTTRSSEKIISCNNVFLQFWLAVTSNSLHTFILAFSCSWFALSDTSNFVFNALCLTAPTFHRSCLLVEKDG